MLYLIKNCQQTIPPLSVIMTCCQNKNTYEQEGGRFQVDINDAKPYISDEESGLIAPNECKIVQLNCPTGIGTIENMKFDKDTIVLLDNSRQRIHIFHKDGVCEHEIFRLGKSSNEYIEITVFFAVNNKIYVLDMSSLKVVEYNYDRQCEGMTNISEFWANSFFVLGDHIFLINERSDTNYGKNHIFEIKKDGTWVKAFIPFENRSGLDSDNYYSFYSTDSIFYAQREANVFGTSNPFIPKSSIYHTMLVDKKEKRIKLVGDSRRNKKNEELFLNIIAQEELKSALLPM